MRGLPRKPLSDAAGVEGEVFGEGDCGRSRCGGPDHGRVIRAQLRQGDDEACSGLRASFFERTAPEGVGGDTTCYDDRGRILEIHGSKELASEGLDYGGLVAGGQVWQLLAELVDVHCL